MSALRLSGTKKIKNETIVLNINISIIDCTLTSFVFE